MTDAERDEERWDDARDLFLKLGAECYIAARFAAAARLLLVVGNLYHHAVEKFLKAYLCRTHSLKDIKNSLRHDLPKLWQALKDAVEKAEEGGVAKYGLDRWGGTVDKLHRFERLRYPDNVLSEGAAITVLQGRPEDTPAPSGSGRVKDYDLFVGEIDDLVALIFEVAGVNPAFLFGGLNQAAKLAISENNTVWPRWFPDCLRD